MSGRNARSLTYYTKQSILTMRLIRSYIPVYRDREEMFKLSKKADYGLIAVKHLATHRRGDHACSANEVADEYGISTTLMAKVLQRLAKEGLVVAKHGSTGGYQLSKDPSQISALDVIAAID